MPVYNHYYPDVNNQINTADSANRLVLYGPTVPVSVSPAPALVTYLQSQGLPVPPPVSGLALIDTGATLCMVDDSTVQALGIPPFGTTSIHTPAGQLSRSPTRHRFRSPEHPCRT